MNTWKYFKRHALIFYHNECANVPVAHDWIYFLITCEFQFNILVFEKHGAMNASIIYRKFFGAHFGEFLKVLGPIEKSIFTSSICCSALVWIQNPHCRWILWWSRMLSWVLHKQLRSKLRVDWLYKHCWTWSRILLGRTKMWKQRHKLFYCGLNGTGKYLIENFQMILRRRVGRWAMLMVVLWPATF